MLFNLFKNTLWAFFALAILQTSALSFTLEVAGNIENTTDPVKKSSLFTDKQLLAMPVRSITTSTSWTPQRKFEGIGVADILARVGAKGSTLTFYALNDYYIDVPLSDVEKYNMILAYKMD
ncbi:oxidoreductase, partial [Escherichia coli]|nr:oxidoreductase [Escherichia coli]